MSKRHFYAAQSPRGFGNEINVYKFSDRLARDAFVADCEFDSDVNSANCGARAVSARRAREIIGYRGDAATESYNSFIEM